jgi:hypothetical protein
MAREGRKSDVGEPGADPCRHLNPGSPTATPSAPAGEVGNGGLELRPIRMVRMLGYNPLQRPRVLVQPPKQIPIGVGHDLIVFDRHYLASAALRTVEARREIFQGNESEASVVPLNLVDGRMIERAACPSRGLSQHCP